MACRNLWWWVTPLRVLMSHEVLSLYWRADMLHCMYFHLHSEPSVWRSHFGVDDLKDFLLFAWSWGYLTDLGSAESSGLVEISNPGWIEHFRFHVSFRAPETYLCISSVSSAQGPFLHWVYVHEQFKTSIETISSQWHWGWGSHNRLRNIGSGVSTSHHLVDRSR